MSIFVRGLETKDIQGTAGIDFVSWYMNTVRLLYTLQSTHLDFIIQYQFCSCVNVFKMISENNMDVYEHERLSNFTLET